MFGAFRSDEIRRMVQKAMNLGKALTAKANWECPVSHRAVATLPWRQGSKVPRNLYDRDGEWIGVTCSMVLAAEIVEKVNKLT